MCSAKTQNLASAQKKQLQSIHIQTKVEFFFLDIDRNSSVCKRSPTSRYKTADDSHSKLREAYTT
jgi:hypothetical protein